MIQKEVVVTSPDCLLNSIAGDLPGLWRLLTTREDRQYRLVPPPLTAARQVKARRLQVRRAFAGSIAERFRWSCERCAGLSGALPALVPLYSRFQWGSHHPCRGQHAATPNLGLAAPAQNARPMSSLASRARAWSDPAPHRQTPRASKRCRSGSQDPEETWLRPLQRGDLTADKGSQVVNRPVSRMVDGPPTQAADHQNASQALQYRVDFIHGSRPRTAAERPNGPPKISASAAWSGARKTLGLGSLRYRPSAAITARWARVPSAARPRPPRGLP